MTRAHAVLVGGAFNGVLSALPVIGVANCLCCLWVVGGGVITAWLQQQIQKAPLELGEGAIGGMLAGVVGAVVYALVGYPVQMLTRSVTGSPLPSTVQIGDVPPELLPVIELMEELASSPMLLVLVSAALMLVLGLIFSTVGGLLGAFFFRREAPPGASAGEVYVPPPPPV